MIAYKGVRHEIMSDAPFIGAVIIAPNCYRGCKGCHNQHLKEDNTILREETAEEIINKVKSRGLNEGIILAGLEWTYSPSDMIELTLEALKNDLEVMIYTYMDEERFTECFPKTSDLPIYIKFGDYKEEEKVGDYYSHGIKLASKNQYIKYMGVD